MVGAATKVQATFRGTRDREWLRQEKLRQEEAATKILGKSFDGWKLKRNKILWGIFFLKGKIQEAEWNILDPFGRFWWFQVFWNLWPLKRLGPEDFAKLFLTCRYFSVGGWGPLNQITCRTRKLWAGISFSKLPGTKQIFFRDGAVYSPEN